jgi:sulfur-oxidizing protein SoxB
MRSGQVTILQVNDTHGYLEPHPELLWDGDHPRFETLGGYARMATLLRRIREEQPERVLTLDNGDTFHGTFPVVESKGEFLVPLLNRLGFDAMTAHWDFAYGPDHLRRIVERLDYPLLAINCYDKESGSLSFPPSRIVERGGLRIGVIGIAATIVDKTMPPHFSTGIRLTLGNEELPGHIDRLRRDEQADLIVVLSHLGFPQDVKLAQEVGEIDILLSGHTHNRLHEPVTVNSATIIQSGCHGSFIGRLDVRVEDGRVASVSHHLLTVDETITPDPAMQHLVDEVMAPHAAMLREVVGHTEVALHRNGMFETPMDNLLLAAIAEAAGTQIAFANGWRYGAPILPGPVTMNDLWNIIPTNPPVFLVELTGAELMEMMEGNLERTFAANPYRQMGGFVKRCLGVNIYAKIENPAGHRIERFFAEGALLEPTRLYTTTYVTAQAVPEHYGRNRRNLPIHAVEALRRYLAGRSSIAPAMTGAVNAV